MELRLELRLTFSGMLRLGSDLPPQSTVGVLGVKDGELGSDRPRRSGCRDEPEATRATKAGGSDTDVPKQPERNGFITANAKVPAFTRASVIHLS